MKIVELLFENHEKNKNCILGIGKWPYNSPISLMIIEILEQTVFIYVLAETMAKLFFVSFISAFMS